MNNSYKQIIDKKLNGHQIDVIRRAIKFLITRDGKCHLVSLAAYLVTLNKNGFVSGNWCGYRKFRSMIEAYPEFFEIYDTESTDLAVRIIGNHSKIDEQEAEYGIDMNFDHFVYNYISPEFAKEVCGEFDLKDVLEDYCVFCNYLIYTYHKAIVDKKVLERGKLRLFHTGWFHNDTDDVFMLRG